MPTFAKFSMIGGESYVSEIAGTVSDVEKSINLSLQSEGFIRCNEAEHGALLLRVGQVRSVYIYDAATTDGG